MGQNHTPGPWTIKQATSSAMVSVYAGGLNVACTGSANVEEDNAHANARLIAAAPDLLAIVKAELDSGRNFGGDGDLYKAARAAIRKAEGGAA